MDSCDWTSCVLWTIVVNVRSMVAITITVLWTSHWFYPKKYMEMFGTKQLLFFWILFLLQSVILTQRQSADEMFLKKRWIRSAAPSRNLCCCITSWKGYKVSSQLEPVQICVFGILTLRCIRPETGCKTSAIKKGDVDLNSFFCRFSTCEWNLNKESSSATLLKCRMRR